MTVDKRVEEKNSEAFLSRWARLKQRGDGQHARLQDKPAAALPIGEELPNTGIGEVFEQKTSEEPHPEPTLSDIGTSAALPSLDSLTPQSDFSPFMARDVDPQLRNLAMKKLFTDPHYNVMDRLDIYIDDYSVHTPLTMDVIRQMNISKTLRLFDDEEEVANVPAAVSHLPAIPSLAAVVESPPPVPDGASAQPAAKPEKSETLKQP